MLTTLHIHDCVRWSLPQGLAAAAFNTIIIVITIIIPTIIIIAIISIITGIAIITIIAIIITIVI